MNRNDPANHCDLLQGAFGIPFEPLDGKARSRQPGAPDTRDVIDFLEMRGGLAAQFAIVRDHRKQSMELVVVTSIEPDKLAMAITELHAPELKASIETACHTLARATGMRWQVTRTGVVLDTETQPCTLSPADSLEYLQTIGLRLAPLNNILFRMRLDETSLRLTRIDPALIDAVRDMPLRMRASGPASLPGAISALVASAGHRRGRLHLASDNTLSNSG